MGEYQNEVMFDPYLNSEINRFKAIFNRIEDPEIHETMNVFIEGLGLWIQMCGNTPRGNSACLKSLSRILTQWMYVRAIYSIPI
jgi:hypothetical protein